MERGRTIYGWRRRVYRGRYYYYAFCDMAGTHKNLQTLYGVAGSWGRLHYRFFSPRLSVRSWGGRCDRGSRSNASWRCLWGLLLYVYIKHGTDRLAVPFL